MARKTPEKIVYYTDPIHDDFAGTNIQKKTVDKHFRWIHKSKLWRACSTVLYYGIAFPLVWFYERVILQIKFVNKKGLKKLRKTPYFLYGNHIGFIDAFTPNLLSVPRANKIVVSPDTVSIKGLRNVVQMLGALPIPCDVGGMRKFMKAVEHYHKKYNITIYPEAHIWPYYTGVRPFSDVSFSYPVKLGAPTVAFFTAFSKPKGFLSCFRKANITVYVSDPLYPDEGLTGNAAKKNLRDKVYAFMLDKAQYSDYEVIRYLYQPQEEGNIQTTNP